MKNRLEIEAVFLEISFLKFRIRVTVRLQKFLK
jgi:hypothetical protein